VRVQRAIVWELATKELRLFFGSPLAYLVIGAFLGLTLFTFFWVEAFFARNISDVRPMFEGLPVLLIFLCSALTMRMWSEERRSGTIEYLMTLPTSIPELVLGKALACLTLIGVSLLLTLPIPVSVSMLGSLDWGPVLAGYLAAALLSLAYLSIGLFVSARTESQIVSLLIASSLCGFFYLIGANFFVDLYPAAMQEVLRSLGSGSRFESITRGLIDVRDMYFYFSISAVFLVLNVYVLTKQGRSDGGKSRLQMQSRRLTGLLVANFLLVNAWMYPVSSLRFDVTEGRIFSISEPTKSYLAQLKEPLRIRGYFSAKTHPLLAPLSPRLKDLLREYEVAGRGKVRLELIDPADNPELEEEANAKYGIRAVPFQISDRYQASLVNSYFDVLIEYGDEYEVLSFPDLIEVKATSESELDVQLKNPEFDITRSIKRVLFDFQSEGSIFDSVSEEVRFVAYLSEDEKLPEILADFKDDVTAVIDELIKEGDGKLASEIINPEADEGEVALKISEDFGFQPMAASLFDENRFYFYLTLQRDETVVQVPLPESFDKESFRRVVEESMKRFAAGMLKTIVLVAPEQVPEYMRRQMQTAPTNQYNQLTEFLSNDYTVVRNNLTDGVVPSEADMMILLEPKNFSEKQVFAVDQFLMKGGTVFLATSPFVATLSADNLSAARQTSGLEGWLEHQGISSQAVLLMDPQNSAFPVPVTRNVGGFSFQDLVLLDYPFFADLRGAGLNDSSSITRGIPQLTLSWSSPIEVEERETRQTTTLLSSSAGSWITENTDVMPKFSEDGLSEFIPEGELKSRDLGILLEGRFDSFFSGKSSPLLQTDEPKEESEDAENEEEQTEPLVVGSVIERSPESARILVIASNDFLADQTLSMVGSADGTLNLNNIQFIANAVDWALEEENLNSISSRGQFNRTLPNLQESTQALIETVNYGIAILLLLFVWWIFRRNERHRKEIYQERLRELGQE